MKQRGAKLFGGTNGVSALRAATEMYKGSDEYQKGLEEGEQTSYSKDFGILERWLEEYAKK